MKFLIFLSVFTTFSFLSQTFRFNNPNPCIFFNYETDKLCVIDDSTSIMMISLETKKLIRRPLHLDKQITFNQLLTEYVPLSEKGSSIYFVDRGCGYVLQLRNDSIVRIDKSFHHQNQFGGAYFLNNGVPSIFGGYGLFSSKNFITQFDIISKEWSIADEGLNMFPASYFPYAADYDNLYILIPKIKSVFYTLHNNVWRFNFKKNKWKLIGQTDYFDTIQVVPALNISFNTLNFYSYFLEFDFKKNKIYRYLAKEINYISKLLKFNKNYVKINSRDVFHSKSSSLTIYDEIDFRKQFLIGESDLIIKSVPSQGLPYLRFTLILLTLLVISYLIYRIFTRKNRPSASYVIAQSSRKLLDLWVFRRHGILELSDLNDLVNAEHLSIETMKKRRELLLKTFVSDMARLHQLSESAVYAEAPNPIDKRMKLLTLHPKIMEITVIKGN